MRLATYAAASSSFSNQMGRWPTSEVELVSNSAGLVFVEPPPPWRDAWHHVIAYEPFTTQAGFGRVISYGRDGKPGGSGADADIERRFP